MSAPEWIRTFASWAPVDERDVGAAQRDAVNGLLRQLSEAGAVPIAGRIELSLGGARPYPPAPHARILLAEARAIVLRHPNPFPRIRLFSWLP